MPRMTISRSSLTALWVLAVPAALTAQGSKPSTHTVKSGDTLWAIARTYLGDPFLWPQVYKLNTGVVEDPHWIYPGEVLQLIAAPGQTAVPSQDTPPPAVPPQAESAPMPVAPPEATPPTAVVRVEPGEGQEGEEPGMALFRRHGVSNVREAFRTYRAVKFHPLRAGEFFSGGFLTEDNPLPFGTLLGPVTPEQIVTRRVRAAVQAFTLVGVTPPEGASYAAGDTLVVVDQREGPIGYGQILAPTGLIRITKMNGSQAVGEVVAVYGTIREGQSVLPAEKFTDPGEVQYQGVSNGLEGRVLIARDHRELRLPQQVLFLDIGKRDGVALGDRFEARRAPGPQRRATADAVDEIMATLEVTHVSERTATVKVRNVVSPDIPPGTRVKLVAKLPG